MSIQDVVIVGGKRTPIGSYLGELKTVSATRLSQIAITEALNTAGVEPAQVDEVILGQVLSSATSSNIARIASLAAGIPEDKTAYTVNRICGSGIQSIINAAQSIKLGEKEVVVAGGVESMSQAPYELDPSVRYEPFKAGHKNILDSNTSMHESCSGQQSAITHMGQTAENLAQKYQITRLSQDQFAYNSTQKALKAVESGRMAQEITPVKIVDRRGNETIVSKDGHLRPDTSLEKLAKLRPAFFENGTVTAGNSSGLNDGAAALVLTSRPYAERFGHQPLARIVDYEVTGLSPELMGLGPVQAIKNILSRQNLTLNDLDLLEINEAFAAQTIACLIELGIDLDSDFYQNKFNVNGGAVALGHPLGMSGARITASLVYELQNRPGVRYAMASACIGGGQGIAILLEKV